MALSCSALTRRSPLGAGSAAGCGGDALMKSKASSPPAAGAGAGAGAGD
eukprot:CAMPEP_0175932054 /NCGR_PEP_ID=MMETSP0108-20121206/19181_1 /TAXON_ID=195067 ORGANISM="Goniomonas pacifica, Strain CCMP1869" /NCGR_SAMPLE_ID=MMETSP0108 /ASSEMBLY_ACC=CAM_ASM_000204 /LENGTH=48 /DNA_ID= /DNA_START= /DNA_END= /DNA_ORIENTATION=